MSKSQAQGSALNKSSISVLQMTQMAMFSAISVALVYLIHFPIFPSAAFLEYDPADIPIFIVTFAFGPLAGLIVTVIVSVVQGLTVSAGGGYIGILMHILATGSFVVIAGNIYKWRRTLGGATVAMVMGTISMVAVMCVMNLIFTPIFMGVPRSAVAGMILPVIMPFNLIKAGTNAVMAFVLYKSVSRFLQGSKGVDKFAA